MHAAAAAAAATAAAAAAVAQLMSRETCVTDAQLQEIFMCSKKGVGRASAVGSRIMEE